MLYIGNQKYKLPGNTFMTPDHYDAEIEYLESDGTQWIDTNVYCGRNIQMVTDGRFTQNVYDENFGCLKISGTHRFHFGIYENKFIFGVGTTYSMNVAYDSNRHTFTLDGSGYGKLDNTKYTLRAFDNANKLKIYLFARNTSNQATTQASFQLYSQKLYENNVLIFDAIPVRVDQIGYMYDKVSGKLFENKGTGNFILGPDIQEE